MAENVVTSEQLSLEGLLPTEATKDDAVVRDVKIPAAASSVSDSAVTEPAPLREAVGTGNLAPMLQHYKTVKTQYPEHLLLFQVGDFYEIFFDDAVTAADALNIRLTSRNKEDANPIPMCGVPIHAVEGYLPKLVARGFSVVLVSQVEEAKDAGKDTGKKGMMRREVTRIITPGVRFAEDGLDERTHNYLAVALLNARGQGSLAYADVSTGHLRVLETEQLEELLEALERVRPAELIAPSTIFGQPVSRRERAMREFKILAEKFGTQLIYRAIPEARMAEVNARVGEASNSKGDLTALMPETLAALSMLLSYVGEVSVGQTPRITDFRVEEPKKAVLIDAATRRNLEIFSARIDGDKKHSLFSHIDYAKTAMGSRLLSDWLSAPSADVAEIVARHDAVEELLADVPAIEELRGFLAEVRDLERLTARVSMARAHPYDTAMLLQSIKNLPQTVKILTGFKSSIFAELNQRFDQLDDLRERLSQALTDEPPSKLNEGDIFRPGYHAEVDRLRELHQNGRRFLAEFEERERGRSGISALKVKFNNVFGYFIEITKSHLAKVPAHYERRQTVANAERFVTPELKQIEQELLSAKARQVELERELFLELRTWLAAQASRIHRTAADLALVDVLSSFAFLARKNDYCRPEINESCSTQIVGGRHPVVENVIGRHQFVANDSLLNTGDRRLAVLTGPNMGGKSTFLRQVGLIQLLGQTGSFVPARSAKLGVVDRIFTRIGASDDLSRGDSTFMVEMREAASIVRRASKRSLVLIDEIGRGTATADGLAIAQSIAEWLRDKVGARTIFATHFHELTALAGEGVYCLSVGVFERDQEIVFTHMIEERAADRSYGLEVARLAGLPENLLTRAQEVLNSWTSHTPIERPKTEAQAPAAPTQGAEVIEKIRTLELDSLTPLAAFEILASCQRSLKDKR